MPLRALEGIQRTLSKPSGALFACLIIALLALVMLVVLAQVLMARAKLVRKARQSWQAFAGRLARWGLSDEQAGLLGELARREAPGNPLDVAERAEVFEKAVHNYLKRVDADPASPAVQRAARLVGSLRTQLKLPMPAGAPAYSTRQLPRGQQLQLNLRGSDGDVSVVRCRVAERRDDVLALAGLSPAEAAVGHRAAEAMLFAGKGAFGFETKILGVDVDAASCTATHSIDIRPAGKREYQRVDVNRPVVFRAAWEPPDVEREGIMLDLGAGGIGVMSPCFYETGEELLVYLQPSELAGGRPGPGEAGLADRTLKARIADSRRTPDGRCRYHVEFRDISQEDRQYLFRLVRRIEGGSPPRAAEE